MAEGVSTEKSNPEESIYADEGNMANEEKKDNNDDDESQYITSFPNNLLLDRAYGVLIGAAIGDSIGSFCEFRKDIIDEEELDHVMKMKGGGTWGKQVISGQVTDDTELAICCAYGLIKGITKHKQIKRLKLDNDAKDNEQEDKKKEYNSLDLKNIAIEYRRWMDSGPFDQGFCTQATLSKSPNVKEMKNEAFEYNARKTMDRNNISHPISKGNMANGSMMRCMPLCLYGYKLGERNLYKIMREDSSLSHAHFCVYIVNTCYAIMIQYLLTAEQKNEKRNIEAFRNMMKWLESETKIRKMDKSEKITSDKEKKQKELKCMAAKEILEGWLEAIDEESICKNKGKNDDILKNLHPATIYQGFIKIAFQRCCYYLLKGDTYRNSIRSVVREGGDSDTNACIVGGLMGAYHGLFGIPNEYIINIHKCQPTYNEKRDPFQAKWYFIDNIAELLIQNAPNDDSFTCFEDY